MGCGGSKDAVVNTNINKASENNNETKTSDNLVNQSKGKQNIISDCSICIV